MYVSSPRMLVKLPFLSYVVHICVSVCMSLRPVHVGVKSEGVY